MRKSSAEKENTMKIVLAEVPYTKDRDISVEKSCLPEGAELSIAVYDENASDNTPFYKEIEDADIIIDGYVYFGKKEIDAMKHCKVISFQSTGYNEADLEYAASKGMPNVYMPHGITLKYIDPVREAVKIPVLVGGCRIDDGEMAENAIASGKCDGVVLARALLAEPEFGNKVREGRGNEICPCIGCNNCLMSHVVTGKPRCAVNPVDMAEESPEILPAEQKKKVVIIGGGVSGMEAAIICAKRGHTVDLYEKTGELGGNLHPAGGHSFKEDIRKLNRWYIEELDRRGVKVHLNTELNAVQIKALKPDVCLVAVGSHPVMPESIPGISKGVDAVSAATGKFKPRGDNVVVVGGGLTGCEIAMDYAMQGKKVTIVEYEKKVMSVGLPTFYSNLTYILVMFYGLGVRQLTGHKLEEVTDNGVIVSNVDTGEKMEVPASDVIIAMGLKANTSVASELEGSGIEVHEIGDAVEIGNIATSTRSAFEVCANL